jgi:tRNA pseudouridine38-40 synthase
LSTKRIRLVVAYDGTDFRGWAAQIGQRTVQRTLTESVRQISGEENEIIGASRTDSGAHALGQVCHFDTESGVPPEKWAHVLNKRLPRDVTAVSSGEVPKEFNSRFWAKDRFYRYRILTGWRDPHRSRFAHHFGRNLDLASMVIGASQLVGKHDFRSFSEELEPGATTIRTLFSVAVNQRKDEVWIDIVGTAFIRGMMRRMAGGLLEVGRGMRPVDEIGALLERQPGVHLPEVLPARGLTLMKIRYGRHPSDVRESAETD